MTIPNSSRCFHINDGILINLISCADSHPRRKHACLTSAYTWGTALPCSPKPLGLGGTVSMPSQGCLISLAGLCLCPPPR
jgi:hypothetical protein